MEHHFLATTEGSSLESFPAWFLKIWPTGDHRQDSFDSWGEARVLFLFQRQHSWKLERKNPEKPGKSTFLGVIIASFGRKTSKRMFCEVVMC